ncbi:MAG: hypothetical protein A2Z99_13050 [Treponema sp. GWB1_62_6]|nr:MAG: hypothetical protein A2Y36_12430 [Treponema sp. GWA1_62_8]OHE63913.1 MAG: hypothetical protein A2001_01760 [Treponema sp. GWC1_61_84]OHE67122.1 MAG: hypothetical protein A2Z99_13050 [Treponema sp. GWB1_62_6]OHE76463.1 MAG: hypothetical protein A2413_03030 [Treponema sp. RIFOXYC1_FULL_61_9]HCM25233.1 hypothetical protein [Treponema sp.]
MNASESIATLADSSSDDAELEKAFRRLALAAAPCSDFAELAAELPAKARWIGPGPWLDAIRDSWRGPAAVHEIRR